jgi:UDP-N-acetylmuramate dehydrogenase
VNTGEASASDIENLILLVQQKIRVQFGIELTPEVHVVGEPA